MNLAEHEFSHILHVAADVYSWFDDQDMKNGVAALAAELLLSEVDGEYAQIVLKHAFRGVTGL